MANAYLLLVQVDDASGEVLGRALNDLLGLGARNVQLVPTLTKKGRPAHLLLLDAFPENLPHLTAYLAGELGIWGYHLIPTEHRHLDVSFREVTIRLADGRGELALLCRVKEIRDGDRLVGLKVDHDFLCHLRDRLKEAGVECSLRVLRTALEGRLWEGATAIRLGVSEGRLTVASDVGKGVCNGAL